MSKQSFLTYLAEAKSDPDLDRYDYKTLVALRKEIKDGAMDPDVSWDNALELVHYAFEKNNVERPRPTAGAWDQYEDLLVLAVHLLQKSTDKGVRDDSWKSDIGMQASTAVK